MQCRHFPACGGCSNLDQPYSTEIQVKSADLADLFADFGADRILPPLEARKRIAFRSKIQLPFGLSRRGQAVVGCYSPGTHRVVDQFECPVQHEDANAILRAVRSWVRYHQLEIYDESTGQGFLRHMVLRQCENSEEILLGLVTTSNAPGSDEEMAEDLWEFLQPTLKNLEAHDLVGCVRHINDKSSNFAFGGEERMWWGQNFAHFDLGKYRFKAHLDTFFQVHLDQAEAMFKLARDWIPSGVKVLELYSGVGALSFFLAEKAESLLGIEINAESTKAATEAALENDVDNCTFRTGDAKSAIEILGDFELLCVDPPRKGIGAELSEAIAQKGPEHLLYISCNPKSLRADAEIFGNSYELVSLRGIDLFPRTSHLEVLSLWRRKA